MDDKEKDFESAFNEAYDLWFPWYEQAHTDFQYFVRNPWTAADLADFKDQGREVLNFNIIRKIVKVITGYERRNRLSLKIGPNERSDDEVASQLTGIVMHLMETKGGHGTVSDAFEMGALVAGANLIEPYFDRNGDIQFARRPYNKFLLDPNFSRRDLSDCNYVIIHEEGMLVEDVKKLVPEPESEIESIAKAGQGPGLLPYSGYLGRGRDPEGKRCNYSSFWERTTRKVITLANRQTGQMFEWKESDKQLRELTDKYPLQLATFTDYKETVKLSCFVNGQRVWSGPDPNKIDEYPFIAVMGFWYPEFDEQADKLQGIVRPIRDPQREVSKRMSKILDIIDSQVCSGYDVEEGALVNPMDAYQSGQGKAVWFREGALAGGKARRREPPNIPSGLFQLNHELQNFVNDIIGVNDALFGTDELKAQVSAYVMKLRTGAAMVTLQDLFDNLRFSKAQMGRKICKLVQANYSPQRVTRILNQQPSADFYKQDLTVYDCIPQEGLLTESQMQMFYTELRQAKAEGAPISWRTIFENAPVQFKKEMLAELDQAEKAQAAQQQELAREKALLDQMRQAKIAADFGRAAERDASVEEHKGDAALARVKTLKELQNMDIHSLLDALTKIKALEEPPAENKPVAKKKAAMVTR